MKKLLLLLALAFLPAPAHAGVSCSLPFTLTNGTTADASQVMANYNAIITCLGNAAASGANDDITALNALTTPLSAGLCGASGFTATNAAAATQTEITMNYSQAAVANSSNQLFSTQTPATLTLNAGTTGANGLDSGSLTASTIYYMYLIGNGSSIASLLSASSTAPTLPSGYTYSCRIGSTETGTGSHLLTFFTAGKRTQINQRLTSNITAGYLNNTNTIGACASGPTFVLTTFAGIPPTATRAFGNTYAFANNGAYVASYAANSLSNTQAIIGQYNPNADIESSAYFDLVLPAAQSLYVCNDGAGPGVNVMGWDDAVNAN